MSHGSSHGSSHERQDALARRDSAAAKRDHAAPNMTLVAGRRRFTWIMVISTTMMMSLMVGAVFVHTMVAERQIQIDEIEQSVRDNAALFDELRAERAELRSPSRLATEAAKLGMTPTVESRYVDSDPMAYARMIALNGAVPDSVSGDNLGFDVEMDPLEQYELVKAVGAELP